VLRTPAEPVTDFDLELRNLVKDLTETMLDAPGVGLAAPQVGLPLQLAVIEDREEYLKDVPADVLEKIRVMLAAMEKHTGKLPIIYTDMTFHHDILEGEHFDNAFWLRSTAAEPPERYGNRRWMMWQWTQTGVLNGVVGEVDRNAFYGDENDWTVFLLTGCDPRVVDALGPQGKCQLVK